MAGPLVKDRVLETCTTTGTGTVTLLGAVSGYQSFAAVGNANTCFYCIVHQTLDEWEVGIGTYTSSGTTLSRTTILASNTGSAVDFSAGTKDVFVTAPAARSFLTEEAQSIIGAKTFTSTLTCSTGQVLAPFGDATAPGWSFDGDPDTGIYRQSSNVLSVATGGVRRFMLQSDQIRMADGTVSLPAFTFINDPDTGFYSAGGNRIIVATGAAESARFDVTNFGLGQTTFGTSATKTIAIGNGTAPSSSPADAAQIYSADVTAGNAAIHVRTEGGGIVKLYQQAANADTSGATLAALETEVNELKALLRNNGLLAT